MNKLNKVDMVAIGFLALGGIQLGLMAFDFNLIGTIFRSWFPLGIKIMYILAGVSGLYSIKFAFD